MVCESESAKARHSSRQENRHFEKCSDCAERVEVEVGGGGRGWRLGVEVGVEVGGDVWKAIGSNKRRA